MKNQAAKMLFASASGAACSKKSANNSNGSLQEVFKQTTSNSHQRRPLTQVNSSNNSWSLLDRLIDSEMEWRQVICEANGGEQCLRQLSELQIKRQEVIHELIQTERHHCLTLALMRQVYLNGLKRLNESRSSEHQQQQLIATTTTTSTHNSSSSSNNNKSLSSLSNHNPQQALIGSGGQDATAPNDLIDLERLFPALEDLIQAHELFFAHLRLRLVESCNNKSSSSSPNQATCSLNRNKGNPTAIAGLVGPLGDLLGEQFRLKALSAQQEASNNLRTPTNASAATTTISNGVGHCASNAVMGASINSSLNDSNCEKGAKGNGYKLLQAYAKFCGQHNDSSRYYKYLMQNDKGFKQFIEQCNKQHPSCRQRGIPECNLLVTQRLTKYPLLIEQLIKTSKDDPEEEKKLKDALAECKGLLAELNNQLARKESFERLLCIYAQFCPKSYTIYNRHLKFTKHDLLQHKRLRQLLHSDGQIRIWSAQRRKLFQVLCLILNDIIVFLRVETQQNQHQSQQNSANSSNVSSSLLSSSDYYFMFDNSSPLLLQQQPPHLSTTLPDNQATALETTATGSSSSKDHHHGQVPLISQCALINVVANALQSANHQLHCANHQVGGNNNGLAAAGGHCSSITSSSSSPAASNNNNLNSSACTNPATVAPASGGSFNVKYYFANIDQKSSVISLSKLLVREKAANDEQPRIYLISSSPRQPEMYELAFVSKRHQTNFVEKLKGCIERHTKSLMDGEVEDVINDDDDLMDDYEDHDGEYEEYGLHEDHQQHACCHHQHCCSGNNNNNNHLDQLQLESRSEIEDSEQEESEKEHEEEEEEDDEVEVNSNPNSNSNSNSKTSLTTISNKSKTTTSLREVRNNVDKKSVPNNNNNKSDNDKRGRESADLDFELDIEQDVIIPATEKENKQNSFSSSSEVGHETSLSFYGTPKGCQLDLESAATISATKRLNEQQKQLSSLSTTTTSGHENDDDEQVDEQTTSSLSDNDELKQQQLASARDLTTTSSYGESGLSERARDSLDESFCGADSSTRSLKTQKLRSNQRRRRAQRPRNISNQSSSSSEAAHRQAIQLIGNSNNHNNPLRQQQANDSSQMTMACEHHHHHHHQTESSSNGSNGFHAGASNEEEFDSGRGHDDSSSAASISSNSMESSHHTSTTTSTTAGGGEGINNGTTAFSGNNRNKSPSGNQSIDKTPTTQKAKANCNTTTTTTTTLLKKSSGISLSSSSISSTLMGSITTASNTNHHSKTPTTTMTSSSREDSPQQRRSTTTTTTTTNKSSSCASSTASACSASGLTINSSAGACCLMTTKQLPPTSPGIQTLPGTQASSFKSNLVKCSSVLSKSACNVKQQRKLSTVSTMSSQLKLLSKLKSSHSPSFNNLCAHCKSIGPDGNNCQQQQQQQLLLSKQARQQMRRSTFIPEQKLEELRDLRIQLDKDKQEWQAKFDKMQEQLLNERRELDLAREKLKQDKKLVANEREQLYRKLDLLREKGILLSPSHKVIITSPEALMYQQQQQQQQQQQCSSSEADGNFQHNQQPFIVNNNVIKINSSINQRQPLQSIQTSGYNSSIRILQPQQQHLNNKNHHQTTNNNLISSHYPLNTILNDSCNQHNNHRQATNLLINNSTHKVPLHLSEQANGNTNNASSSATTTQRVTSSFSLSRLPPLMQVLSGSILNVSDSKNNNSSPRIESHLI